MIRVLVVDDQPTFRRRLCRLLTQAGLRVVGQAGTIAEAEGEIQLLDPDLAVVDLVLPGIDGLEGVSRLKLLRPALRVILISVIQDHVGLVQAAAIRAGAEGFVRKDDLDLNVVESWKARGLGARQ